MTRRFLSSLTLLAGLVMVGAVGAWFWPSSKRHPDPDINFLASDAHVVVGDVPLILPFVALTDYVTEKSSFSLDRQRDREVAKGRLAAFRAAAINPQTAPSLDQLEVRVGTYGWNDFKPSIFRKICARLSRQWSRSVCDDPWAPLQQAVPKDRFFLVDDRKFDALGNHGTVGGERVSDQLREMRLKAGEASVVCDRTNRPSTTKFCTAAISIRQHLAVVWTVWDSTEETHSRQAEREGKAITAFMHYATGSSEDFPALFSAVCELRNPMSHVGPRGGLCDRPPASGSR